MLQVIGIKVNVQTQLYLMKYTIYVHCRKYKIYLYELQKQAEQRAFGELFMPVSQRVQMNVIFNDNVRILCLSCNVKKVGKLVRFKQKGQKQASFLAFHKCCQGVSSSWSALHQYQFHTCLRPPAVHSYRVPGKFIRRLKSLFVQYEYSKNLFVQHICTANVLIAG